MPFGDRTEPHASYLSAINNKVATESPMPFGDRTEPHRKLGTDFILVVQVSNAFRRSD